jgi:predicted phage terminase large subunit-like protein
LADLKVTLHPDQLTVFSSNTRFKVVAAGRRWGKSRLAAWILLIKALGSPEKDVFYVAPTFQQAKDIMWGMLKDLGRDVIQQAHENTGVLTLVNGRKIYLKGSDRPDTLRGVGLSYIVLDEYASMKPEVWETILRPTLADVKGEALFIGTPDGKNHFYDLYLQASLDEAGDWEAWTFASTDNPFLDSEEIKSATRQMSTMAFRQEFEASFESFNSGLFKEEWIKYATEEDAKEEEGEIFVAVDPAGFEDVAGQAKNKKSRLDETSIAVVKVTPKGWYVLDIQHGRWNVRETSIRILRAAQKHHSRVLGIEKGSLKNALMPYMEDQMRRTSFYPRIEELTHGNKKKTERITWALQGRMEHGRFFLVKGSWNRDFVSQLMDFPNPLVHDDLLDSVAYIAQIGSVSYIDSVDVVEYEVLDDVAGY